MASTRDKITELLSALHTRVSRLEGAVVPLSAKKKGGVKKEIRRPEHTDQPMTELMKKVADMCEEEEFSFKYNSRDYLPGQPEVVYMSVTGEDGSRLGIILEYQMDENEFIICRKDGRYEFSFHLTKKVDQDVAAMRTKLRNNLEKLIKNYNEGHRDMDDPRSFHDPADYKVEHGGWDDDRP